MARLPKEPLRDGEAENLAVALIKVLDGLAISDAIHVLRTARDRIAQTHRVDAEECRAQMIAAEFVQPRRDAAPDIAAIRASVLGLDDPASTSVDTDAVRREIERVSKRPAAQLSDIVECVKALALRIADRDPTLMAKDRSDVV